MNNENAYMAEAVAGFTPRTAMEEAARCLLCHDAPCSKSCPAGTDPAKFIRSIRFRNVKGAAETIRENNVLAGSCARVCPYDRLCEQACSRCGIDRPIEIGRLQRFAVEQEKQYGMKILQAGRKEAGKIACIGGGPASLTVAAELAKKGYDVTIYEAQSKMGGYLTYGIIPARLPQEVVDFDIGKVAELGVRFVVNTKVGQDISFAQIRREYDAVFIGIGLWQPKLPDIPGRDLAGVTNAIDFLKCARESGGKAEIGRRILVIGGGDVAMDCAATAQLLGAEKVSIWYRRSLNEAPAGRAEIEYVTKLGISITTDMVPKAIEGNGRVAYMRFTGRDGESEACIACDQVVFAIGQAPEIPEGMQLETGSKGLLSVQADACSLEGVFAAGDIVNGGRTVVEAVASGKAAAESIAAYLAGKENK